MRSAWVCTRNDVLGNLAVLIAAAGVFGTGTGWPDVIVAAVIAILALQGATAVIRQARFELQSDGRMTPGNPYLSACVPMTAAWRLWIGRGKRLKRGMKHGSVMGFVTHSCAAAT